VLIRTCQGIFPAAPPAKRSKNPNSPINGFAARIHLKDPCVPITSRHIKPLGVAYNNLHRHPEFEICYFPSDSGTFMIQDREYPIRRGDIFIVNANDIHQPILCNEGNDGALVVYFSPRLFADASEGAEWAHAFILASLCLVDYVAGLSRRPANKSMSPSNVRTCMQD